MKKLIFTLSFLCFIAAANAQYCGSSGSTVCTPQVLSKPGLSPVSDSLAPIIQGSVTATTIYFQNFDTITFGGHTLTIDSLHIDTINNLPGGLCWATSSADNTFANQQNGCIQVTGTENGPCGQYKLYIIVTAYVPFGISTNADAAGLKYFVRVDATDTSTIVPVDTTQSSANPYIAYPGCVNGITKVDANIQSLTVFPNPMTSQAVVTFNSVKSGAMTEKLTTVIGTEVYRNTMDVTLGNNTRTINRNGLAAGVYFYTIADGTSSVTQRIVISE